MWVVYKGESLNLDNVAKFEIFSKGKTISFYREKIVGEFIFSTEAETVWAFGTICENLKNGEKLLILNGKGDK